MLFVVAATMTLAACANDNTEDAGRDGQALPLPSAADETIPPDRPPALSTDPPNNTFVDGLLQDDQVTHEELESAYQRYIGCLDAGGASGVYAWDISLDVGVVTDGLALAGDDPQGTHLRSLQAECQRDFLGDLQQRFDAAHPQDPAELVARQRASMVSCIAAVNPDVAANVPDDVTVNTEFEGVAAIDLQLDPTLIGAEGDDALPVERCIGSLGAPYSAFP